jgi:hypothetical protein
MSLAREQIANEHPSARGGATAGDNELPSGEAVWINAEHDRRRRAGDGTDDELDRGYLGDLALLAKTTERRQRKDGRAGIAGIALKQSEVRPTEVNELRSGVAEARRQGQQGDDSGDADGDPGSRQERPCLAAANVGCDQSEHQPRYLLSVV